jgi:hypothetical protein
MVAACLFPEPEKDGRGQKGSVTEQFDGIPRRALSEARTVTRGTVGKCAAMARSASSARRWRRAYMAAPAALGEMLAQQLSHGGGTAIKTVAPGDLFRNRHQQESIQPLATERRERRNPSGRRRALVTKDEWRAIPLNQIAKHTRIPKSAVRWHRNKMPSSQVAKIEKPAARTVTRGGTF